MNLRLDGKVAATAIKEELKNKFSSLPTKACLGIIRFDDPASESYLKGRLKIANELGLLVSGGSDYHGINTKPDVMLGTGINNNLKIKKPIFVDWLLVYLFASKSDIE